MVSLVALLIPLLAFCLWWPCAALSRPTLNKFEQGDASVTMGSYLRVLSVLGLDQDLAALAADDVVGRRLQDAELATPRRAPKAT